MGTIRMEFHSHLSLPWRQDQSSFIFSPILEDEPFQAYFPRSWRAVWEGNKGLPKGPSSSGCEWLGGVKAGLGHVEEAEGGSQALPPIMHGESCAPCGLRWSCVCRDSYLWVGTITSSSFNLEITYAMHAVDHVKLLSQPSRRKASEPKAGLGSLGRYHKSLTCEVSSWGLAR